MRRVAAKAAGPAATLRRSTRRFSTFIGGDRLGTPTLRLGNSTLSRVRLARSLGRLDAHMDVHARSRAGVACCRGVALDRCPRSTQEGSLLHLPVKALSDLAGRSARRRGRSADSRTSLGPGRSRPRRAEERARGRKGLKTVARHAASAGSTARHDLSRGQARHAAQIHRASSKRCQLCTGQKLSNVTYTHLP